MLPRTDVALFQQSAGVCVHKSDEQAKDIVRLILLIFARVMQSVDDS
jgi:hypothetical protein